MTQMKKNAESTRYVVYLIIILSCNLNVAVIVRYKQAFKTLYYFLIIFTELYNLYIKQNCFIF